MQCNQTVIYSKKLNNFHIFQFIIDYANVEQITIYIAQSEMINDTPTVKGILT
jgi:hypothetical protein